MRMPSTQGIIAMIFNDGYELKPGVKLLTFVA